MRIVQIVSGMYIASAGPSYTIARMCEEMYRSGEDISILTSGRPPESWPYPVPLQSSTGWLNNRLSVSPSLVRDIRERSMDSDILHGNSMWRFANNVFPLALPANKKAKIVCSPRGSMSAWSMNYKGKLKQPFWRFIQKPALDRCHMFHATSEAEYEDIRRLGLRAPVAIIPNGVDMPELQERQLRDCTVVFLGRINPVKGIDMLINAWKTLQADHPDWRLVIAGPLTDGYADEMQQLAAANGGAGNIGFAGEVQGEEKARLLSSASLFVLPSHSENFGMVVAEALSYAVPVITTTGTPWSALETHGCGWCVAPGQQAITASLGRAMQLSPEVLSDMGAKGRRWMEQDYAWRHVAGTMLSCYKWLLNGGTPPAEVVLD